MSNSSNGIAISKNHKFLLFCLLAPFLVTCATSQNISSKTNPDNQLVLAQTIIQSSCSSTLYPDLCVSAISGAPNAASKIKNPKDVIELSLNLTIAAVQANYNKIKKLSAEINNLTQREKTAFSDCMEMIDETLDELYKVEQDLEEYPSFKKSISSHADDLKTLVSAAMTNQDSCLYGFSYEEADKKVGKLIKDDELHVYHMCSNALAMITNLTDTDMAKEKEKNPNSWGRNPEAKRINHDGTEWPEWLSGGDRKLLQAGTATPDVVVASDGSGDFRTVTEAVAAAPERSSKRYIIRIKAGVYRENVDVPKKKTNIMFLGDGKATTIITGNRNVVDGSTTFNSATVAAVGEGFLARDITFQNTAGPSKHQAVALRVGSDLSAFYQCDMIAYQDTLYVHSLRQFYVNCFITGTVDFIFGNAAAVLQNCDIRARRPNAGQRNLVTAQGRNDPNQNTGIVIQKSNIGATQDLAAVAGSFRSFLGRPWRLYSRTVVMQSEISEIIDPAGWHEWDGNFALDTLFYAEYKNTGGGADTSNRVQWKGFKVITDVTEAQGFTAGNFIQGGSWLSSTGFPFTLGLETTI